MTPDFRRRRLIWLPVAIIAGELALLWSLGPPRALHGAGKPRRISASSHPNPLPQGEGRGERAEQPKPVLATSPAPATNGLDSSFVIRHSSLVPASLAPVTDNPASPFVPALRDRSSLVPTSPAPATNGLASSFVIRHSSFLPTNPAPVANGPAGGTTNMAAPIAPVSATPEAKAAAEAELRKIMEADGVALAEVDGWIRDNQQFAAKGAGAPAAELNHRILTRIAPVRQAYEEFLQHHPDHVRARLAFAAFLDDLGEEAPAREQNERALALDPSNPAVYNNLALNYAQDGPTAKAFEYFAKAIELAPREARYYGNLAKTAFLFRPEATNYFGLTEPQLFEKVLTLYSNALRLDPQNFLLATDLAQTYYALGPRRADDALCAWTNALNLATDDLQRQGVHAHLARVKIQAGRLAEARAHLNALTYADLAELKASLARQLEQREQPAPTNGRPAAPGGPVLPAAEPKRP